MRVFGFVFAVVLVVLPRTTLAESESEVLFRKGKWFVEVTYGTDNDSAWCAAVTDNGRGQQFDITIFRSQHTTLYIWDQAWELKEISVDFRLDVDRERWNMSGKAKGSSISLNLTGAKQASTFLKDVYSGNSVALFSDSGRKLASFSLSGSAAALLKLFECAKRIENDPATSDPFGDDSDPFG